MSRLFRTTLAFALVAGVGIAAPSMALAKKAKSGAMMKSKKSSAKAPASSPAMDENRKIMMQKSKEANEKKSGM